MKGSSKEVTLCQWMKGISKRGKTLCKEVNKLDKFKATCHDCEKLDHFAHDIMSCPMYLNLFCACYDSSSKKLAVIIFRQVWLVEHMKNWPNCSLDKSNLPNFEHCLADKATRKPFNFVKLNEHLLLLI